MTFMMIDADVVCVSPTTTYRVLSAEGRLDRWSRSPSKKGTGFRQPKRAHQHWHMDIAYINIGGTFYYLCSVLDGFSRAIVHWELRPSMTEADVEVVLQRAREQYPNATPRLISDNGPQFIARDFKTFIRLAGMTHVRTSPYYPQSNGKSERWHKTLKTTTIRPNNPSTEAETQGLIARFVIHYNTVRLQSALGYVAPYDKLAGRDTEILKNEMNGWRMHGNSGDDGAARSVPHEATRPSSDSVSYARPIEAKGVGAPRLSPETRPPPCQGRGGGVRRGSAPTGAGWSVSGGRNLYYKWKHSPLHAEPTQGKSRQSARAV